MTYATEQKPSIGDAVCDYHLSAGTVTHILRDGSIVGELVIRWNDGTTDILYPCHEAIKLDERRWFRK